MKHRLIPTTLAIAIAATFSYQAAAADKYLTAPGTYGTADHWIVQNGQTLDGKNESLTFTSGSSTDHRLTVDGNIVNLKDLHVAAGGFTNTGNISMTGNLSFGALNNGASVSNNGTIKAGSLSTTWSAGFKNNAGAVLDVESGVFDVANTLTNNGTIIIHGDSAHFKTGHSVVFGESATIKDHEGNLVSIVADKTFTNNSSLLEVNNFTVKGDAATNNGILKVHGDFTAGNYYSDADSELHVAGTTTIGYITEKAFGSLTTNTLHITKAAVSHLHSITAENLIIDSSASLYDLKNLNIQNLTVHGTDGPTGSGYVAFKFQDNLPDSDKVVRINKAFFDGQGRYSGLQLFNADLELDWLTIADGTKGMVNFYEGTSNTAKITNLHVLGKGTFYVSAEEGGKDGVNQVEVNNAIFEDGASITRKEGHVRVVFNKVTAGGNLSFKSLGTYGELAINSLNAQGGVVTLDQQLSGTSSTITINEGASVSLNKGTTVDSLNVNLNTMETNAFYVDSVGENTQTNIIVDGRFNDKSAQEIIHALDATVQVGKDDNGAFDFVIQEGDIFGAITGNSDGTYTQANNTKLTAFGSVTALSALTLRHEMNSLSKRMGELRDAPTGVGAWVRAYGSEMEYGDQNLTSKNNSIQVGSDYSLGDWKVGVAVTYTDGDSSYIDGSADSKGYGFALYGTWFVPCGAYVDLMAKYTRLDTDFALNGMNGSYDTDAYGVSAETGYRFNFLNNGVYVEPQVGVAYSHMFGENITATNGVSIEQDDYDSLIGRVGVRTGFNFPEDKGTIYARVSAVYDFEGDVGAIAHKGGAVNSIQEDLGGAWVEMGVGANFNWTKDTYTYVDFERTNGGEVKENYRWNVGLRHTF